jgi:hypothetical protein
MSSASITKAPRATHVLLLGAQGPPCQQLALSLRDEGADESIVAVISGEGARRASGARCGVREVLTEDGKASADLEFMLSLVRALSDARPRG